MNREIKFRGKRLDNGEWVYGSLLIVKSEYIADVYKIHVSTPHEVEKCNVYEVDAATVGQYIGMKDRNGKEIYEGDILRIDGFNTEGEAEEWVVEVGQYGEVAYSTADSDYSLLAWIDNFVEYEIVGNIYDNPELLKGGK